MSDLIIRDDLINEFKAQKDAWGYYGESFYNEKYIRFDDVINTIREFQSFNGVLKCRDCKYASLHCTQYDTDVDALDGCSNGERDD